MASEILHESQGVTIYAGKHCVYAHYKNGAGVSDDEWMRRLSRDVHNMTRRVARRRGITYRAAKKRTLRALRQVIAAHRKTARATT